MKVEFEKELDQNIIYDLQEFSAKYCTPPPSCPSSNQVFRGKPLVKFERLLDDLILQLTASNNPRESIIASYRGTILMIVRSLIKYITAGDNVIDSYFEERNLDNLGRYIQNVRDFVLIPWELYEYIKKLPNYDPKNVLRCMRDLLDSAILEVKYRKDPRDISEEELKHFLAYKNGNFMMYLSLFTAFLPEEAARAVTSFFQYYCVVDTILDDIADLKEDFEGKSYNLIQFKVSTLYQGKIDSFQALLNLASSTGTLDWAVAFAQKQGETARKVIAPLPENLRAYLGFILDGALAAIQLLNKNKFFLSYASTFELFMQLILFSTKPYPWCRVDLGEVLKNQIMSISS